MALRMSVKLNNVTHLTDARYGAGMGVEWIGFCLDSEHANYITAHQYMEMSGWIVGIKRVGEFYQKDVIEIKNILSFYSIDWIETERIDQVVEISKLGYPIILRLKESDLEKIANLIPSPFIQHILLEVNHLTEAYLEKIKKEYPHYKIIISNPIQLSQLPFLFTYADGIALTGKEEIKTGYKDFGELAEILEALEED